MLPTPHKQFAAINNACLMVLAAAAVTAVLVYTKTVLLPFVIALFIYMLGNTLSAWVKEKWKVPAVVTLISFGALILTLGVFAFIFVSSSIETFIAGAGIYTEKLNDTFAWALQQTQRFGLNFDPNHLTETASQIPLFNVVKSVGSGLMSFLTNTVLVLLFLIFLFMGKASADQSRDFVGHIQKQISYYLLIKIGVSLLAALCTWVVLLSLGAELAFMVALLTFMLNFIPNIGPLIATLLPLPVLFLQYGMDWHIVATVSLLTTMHFLIGNVLETKWLGKGMDLDPVVVIASLIFWALVWGVMGALLAVPLTSILKIACEQTEPTRPLAKLLSGSLFKK